jgi:hypothetical protein
MQLTPRNLVMACAAILAGGAVFGAITTLMPAVSLPAATTAGTQSPTPTALATAATTTDGLGDEEITFPASPAPTSSTWPTPIPTSPVPASPIPSTPGPASPVVSPTPTAVTSSAQAASPAPTARPSGVPSPSAASPRVTARAGTAATPRATLAPRRVVTPSPTRQSAPAPRRTTVAGGWRAPGLHVGSNAITLPRLTSGATVRVTVGCSPSSACQVTGDQLVIDPAATAVTVTWWAPARAGFRAWQVSRAL